MLNKKISSHKWVYKLLLVLISSLSFIYIFNITIDPYAKQNYFCEQKYKPVLNERAKKYTDIFYDGGIKNYSSLILGSSRVMTITPAHFDSTKSFYNFGVHVANNTEKLFILEEWLKVKKLKKVYLGIDYYNFHKLKRPLFVDHAKFKNSTNMNYFSINTTKLSYKSLKNKLQNTPKTFFNHDGSINYFNKDKLIKENKYDFTKKSFQHNAQQSIDKSFEIEYQVFSKLQEIKKLSKKYNFELFVFITPMQQEMIYELEKYPNILHKHQIIDDKLLQIFEKIYKFNTKNRYNNNTENFYDLHHYRAILGDKILKVLDNTDSDYGQIFMKKESN